MIEGKLGEMGRNPRTVQVCTDSPVPGGGSGIAVKTRMACFSRLRGTCLGSVFKRKITV